MQNREENIRKTCELEWDLPLTSYSCSWRTETLFHFYGYISI